MLKRFFSPYKAGGKVCVEGKQYEILEVDHSYDPPQLLLEGNFWVGADQTT